MHRILLLAVAMLLISSPVLAAGAADSYGNSKGGSQKDIVNITTVKNAAVIANGKGSEANIGNVTNENGKQEGVVNITTMKNSAVIANDGGKTNIGNVSNK